MPEAKYCQEILASFRETLKREVKDDDRRDEDATNHRLG